MNSGAWSVRFITFGSDRGVLTAIGKKRVKFRIQTLLVDEVIPAA